jgi:hypothetical protein
MHTHVSRLHVYPTNSQPPATASNLTPAACFIIRFCRGIWRNGLLFSPIIQYGTYTYKQIMLDPMAKALAAALRTVSAEGTLWPMPNLDRPRVYFALQGEL